MDSGRRSYNDSARTASAEVILALFGGLVIGSMSTILFMSWLAPTWSHRGLRIEPEHALSTEHTIYVTVLNSYVSIEGKQTLLVEDCYGVRGFMYGNWGEPGESFHVRHDALMHWQPRFHPDNTLTIMR